jgi:DNA mismatch endonuclease (patch repair protein)
MIRHPLWKESRPPDIAWRAPAGLCRLEREAEQDRAAGGRIAREISHTGRPTHASIALRVLPKSRRIYAYLRWSVRGKTHERYVGEVDLDSRERNLALAWRVAREESLLDVEPPSARAAEK